MPVKSPNMFFLHVYGLVQLWLQHRLIHFFHTSTTLLASGYCRQLIILFYVKLLIYLLLPYLLRLFVRRFFQIRDGRRRM